MIIGLIASFCVIVLIDIRNIFSVNNRRKTIFVYLCLITAAFTISLLLILDKEPISPSEIIEKIINYIIMRN